MEESSNDSCLSTSTMSQEKLQLNSGESDGLFRDSKFDVKGQLTKLTPQWKRPKQIVAKPEFIDVSGSSRVDVAQGHLGDCWFLAAVSVIADYPHLFKRVVPDGQNFGEQYSGAFRFKFFEPQSRHWCTVTIDDLLPTRDNKLILGWDRQQPNEFWPALLEKAFAKFKGGYEKLDGGFMSDALVNLTGGIGERIDLHAYPVSFTELLAKYNDKVLLGCSIRTDLPNSKIYDAEGVFCQHAYSISDVVEIQQAEESYQLIRVRNPWGCTEWKGPWSDGSVQWNELSADTITRLQVVSCDDGEFWMHYEDWKKHFNILSQCVLNSEDALMPDTALRQARCSLRPSKATA
jgi:hypothetical protein